MVFPGRTVLMSGVRLLISWVLCVLRLLFRVRFVTVGRGLVWVRDRLIGMVLVRFVVLVLWMVLVVFLRVWLMRSLMVRLGLVFMVVVRIVGRMVRLVCMVRLRDRLRILPCVLLRMFMVMLGRVVIVDLVGLFV